jgi:hypothetical protein
LPRRPCTRIGVVILFNENGIEKDLESNCGFVGTLVFVGVEYNDEEGDYWATLNDEQIRKCMAWCRNPEKR